MPFMPDLDSDDIVLSAKTVFIGFIAAHKINLLPISIDQRTSFQDPARGSLFKFRFQPVL